MLSTQTMSLFLKAEAQGCLIDKATCPSLSLEYYVYPDSTIKAGTLKEEGCSTLWKHDM